MDEQRRLAIYNGIKANRTKTQQPKVRKETMFFVVARGLCEYYVDPRAGKVSHRWLMNKILREFSKNLWGHYSMSDDEIITEAEMNALNDDDIANLPILNEYIRTHRMTMDQCFEVLCTNGRNITQDVGTSGTAGQSSGPAPSAQPSDARASQQGPLTTAAQPTDARASQPNPTGNPEPAPKPPTTASHGSLSNSIWQGGAGSKGKGKATGPDEVVGVISKAMKDLNVKDNDEFPAMPPGTKPDIGGPRPQVPKRIPPHTPGVMASRCKSTTVLEYTYPLPPNFTWDEHFVPIKKKLARLLRVTLSYNGKEMVMKMYTPPNKIGMSEGAVRAFAETDFYRADKFITEWYQCIVDTKDIPDIGWFIGTRVNAEAEELVRKRGWPRVSVHYDSATPQNAELKGIQPKSVNAINPLYDQEDVDFAKKSSGHARESGSRGPLDDQRVFMSQEVQVVFKNTFTNILQSGGDRGYLTRNFTSWQETLRPVFIRWGKKELKDSTSLLAALNRLIVQPLKVQSDDTFVESQWTLVRQVIGIIARSLRPVKEHIDESRKALDAWEKGFNEALKAFKDKSAASSAAATTTSLSSDTVTPPENSTNSGADVATGLFVEPW